jgi:enoyl-CoA hydratase
MSTDISYDHFSSLDVKVEDGLGLVTMTFSGGDQATRSAQQSELGQLWRILDRDPAVRSVVITGTGDEFYLSGRPPGSPDRLAAGRDAAKIWPFTMKIEHELGTRIHEMINFSKPVVAAINGGTAGAGLGVALLSDITIAAEDAYLFDPHTMLGMAAGDGPPAFWPLFTGIAKTKLYVLTSDALSGLEAERIGLIGLAVPREQLMETALDYGRRLAAAPPVAIRFTKRAINQWFRLALLVAHDYSFALEKLAEYSGEREGAPHTDWPPRLVP